MKKYKREYFGKTLKDLHPVYYKNKYFDCSLLDDDVLYHVTVYNEDPDWWYPSCYEIIDNLGKIKNTSSKTCNKEKKVYQLVFDPQNERFDRTDFHNFMWNDMKAKQVMSCCYWFETEMTPEEIVNKIKPMLNCYDPPMSDTLYVMEIHPNMECWIGSPFVEWFKEKMEI